MKNFLHKIWPFLLLGLLCLLIITIWFKDGKMLATGEDSLIIYNPQRAIEMYKYSWHEVVSGEASPGWNARIPLLYTESLILKLDVPIWIFQAILFFLLMYIGSISTYLLSKELLKKYITSDLETKVGFIASLFYIFNPVSLLTIWDRGMAVYSFIFFYALVPLFTYLYVQGLNRRKFSFIIITTFITLFFSTAFSSPSEPFLLWVLPFIYSLVIIFFDSSGNRTRLRYFPIIYFLTTFAVWVLINLWWIYPWVGFAYTEYFSQDNLDLSINTLKANSKDYSLENVIRLIHGGYLFRNEAYGSIYKNPIFLLISWLIPIIAIYGLVKLEKGRTKLFLLFSFVILIFAAKGTSRPLGEVFLWLFININVLQILRNSFEKVGMLLPTVYAPLFSFGLLYFLSRYKSFKTRNLMLLAAVTCLMVYNWPFFTGALVKFGTRDIRVEVPPSFNQANKAIPAGDHLIFSVPVMGGSSGLYKWDYGFKGIEAGKYLFNYPIVTTLYYANSFYGQMLIAISNSKLNNLIGSAQFFSTDIIALRKDMDLKAYGYNLDAVERYEKLIKSANLRQFFDSKEVSLWTLPKEEIVPVVYAPKSVRLGQSAEELILLLENHQYNPKEEVFICINKQKCRPYLKVVDTYGLSIEKAPEKIEVNKISPVNYQIKVHNSQGRFILVFNNTYHPGWSVVLKDKELPEDRHIIANGYANGFIIDEHGNFDITLHFAPEEKLQNSYRFSQLAIILGVFSLVPLLVLEFRRVR